MLLAGPQAAESEEVTKIVILPFHIYAPEGKELLQQAFYDALSRELAQIKTVEILDRKVIPDQFRDRPPEASDLAEIGRLSGATHLITGTITQIGQELNIDVRIYDVQAAKLLPPVTARGRGLESISTMATSLKNDILVRVAARLRIARIEFRGNERIETGVLNQAIKSTQGSLYSEKLIATDIKELFKLGYFDDIAVDVTDTPEGKVVVYQVKEKGLITDIVFQGNKAIKTDDLEATITFKTKQVLNTGAIAASIEKLKELYASKGYYNADIQYKIESERPKEVRVVFTIKEGERLYIRKISFEGNHTFREKELKKLMKTEEWDLLSWLRDTGILKRDILRQDVNKINVFYFNNGFIYAQVGEPEVTFHKKGIYIKIKIEEGKRYKVGQVTISGDTLKQSREALMEKLTVTKKVFFDRSAVMKDIETLKEACNDEGHAYADIDPNTKINDAEQVIDVDYNITKGPLVYFHRVNITGNTSTRDKVIRRMLYFTEGELYSSTKLKDSYKNMERTRFFEEIDFEAQPGRDKTLTDINIRVKEKRTGMFSIGAAYSALDGAMAMASISQQNLFGRAQSLYLRATIGQYAQYYDLTFIDPWFFDTNIWSRFELWNMLKEYDTYRVSTSGVSPTLGYPIWPKYSIYGYLQYAYSMSKLKDVWDNASWIIKAQKGTYTQSAITPSLSRDTTDDPNFPTKGTRASVHSTLSGAFLGGNTHFVRYGAKGGWYTPVPFDCVFDIRGEIGYLQEIMGEEIPVYELYYVGGIDSIRGLRWAGPKDPITGDLIGGRALLVLNFDLVFPLLPDAGIRGVVFFDTGNAWENSYRFDDMRETAGFGIHWNSPFGPLRVEIGFVLDRQKDESASRVEFSMGAFK